MGYGATNFMGATSKHILSTEIFPDFIHLYSRGDKKNKNSKPLTRINSTESFTRDMVLNFFTRVYSWATHTPEKLSSPITTR